MVKNIVFDMGQVLIHWQPKQLLARFLLSEEEETLVLRELFQDVEWVQLDHGTISMEEAVARVCARLPEKLHKPVEEIVMGWWQRPLSPVAGMGELVAELKANGYGIYLLSNANLALRSYFPRIPGSECFDGLMDSAEEKLLKPSHEIYEALYKRFGLKPAECIFIDDSPANVEGAISTGMPGIVFRGDVSRLRRELVSAGIRCKAE